MKNWNITFIKGIPYPFLFANKQLITQLPDTFTFIIVCRAADLPYPIFIESAKPQHFLFIKDYNELLEKWEETFCAK